MIESNSADETLKQIIAEAKRMTKSDRQLLLKEIKIRRLLSENKPIVRAKTVKPLSLEEINEIKHLSRKKDA